MKIWEIVSKEVQSAIIHYALLQFSPIFIQQHWIFSNLIILFLFLFYKLSVFFSDLICKPIPLSKYMDYKVVQDYVITPVVLGKGCFGTVFRGYMKNNKSQLLAVKAIPLISIKNEDIIRRQIEILLKLDNPNIVKFYKPSRTKNHLYFFLEYCQQDLKTYVANKGGRLSESQVRDILRQICNGFKEVHHKNIIHRDVKPANFLIHNGVVKIADFGFARVVDSVDESALLTFLGSPLYMAPQVLAKQKFSSKCDVWSLGVTIYEILYGRTPFTAKSPKQLLDRILSEPLTFPQNIKRSDEIKDLLRKMLQVNEEDRISWNELFVHPVVNPTQQKIQQSSDNLLQSYRQNQNYMKNNKVASKTSSVSIEQIKKTKEQQSSKKPEVDVGGDFDKDVKLQDEKINEYIKVDEVDELMRYKRNVSVFLNVQCNSFFTQLADKFEERYFYLGLYVLLRRQIYIHKQLKQQLSCGKPKQKISGQIWIQYLKSSAHSRITRLIQSDLKHLSSYFKQVKMRMIKCLQKYQGEQIMGVFEKFFLNDDESFNEEAFKRIIDFLIEMMLKQGVKDSNLKTKLKITENPFKYLDQTIDFGLFYERQNEQLQLLREKFPELKD